MKLTKKDIENLAVEVRKWASSNRLGKDWVLFYNGKKMEYKFQEGTWKYKSYPTITKGVSPLDYCEWFSEKFIMGMAYDGFMYEVMNGYTRSKAYEKLEALLADHGLYIEHCDSCHCEFVCYNIDIEDVEYTEFKKERPRYLYTPENAPDAKIERIMLDFRRLADEVGDIGACIIGEYIEFRYKGVLYRMSNQSPHQGDYSFSEPASKVKEMLAEAGATDIWINYGMLD